jgi:hypothetical protein
MVFDPGIVCPRLWSLAVFKIELQSGTKVKSPMSLPSCWAAHMLPAVSQKESTEAQPHFARLQEHLQPTLGLALLCQCLP